MSEKYFWVSYVRPQGFGSEFSETITKKHPFEFVQDLRERYEKNYIILNWKEVTKEEFDLYNK